MMDICIFYEHAQRELNNAYLLKFELEKRGYEVTILKNGQARIPYFEKPKLVVSPWLYNDHQSMNPLKICFFRGFDKIINLQYEQVISKMWLERGFHCPSGLAQNAVHVCWSDKIKRRLISVGVPECNCFVAGDLKTDLSKYPFNQIYKSKKELADEFNIPINHKWNIFISSFSFTGFTKDDLEFIVGVLGKEKVEDFHNVQIESQKEILNWIELFVQEHPDVEFIYRPHPSELDNDRLLSLNEKYVNFHYISKYSVQEWIVNCDFINSWISTSLIEVYVLGKNCNILRPFKLNEYFDIPYFIDANHVKEYESFEMSNLEDNSEFPVSEEELAEYYLLDDGFVYKKIADYIEVMVSSDEYKGKFYKYPPILECIKLLFLRVFSKNLLIFIKWFFSKGSVENTENEVFIDDERKNKLKNFVYNNK